MLSADSFLTSSLRNSADGLSIARILAAAIAGVEPGTVIERSVHREGNILSIGGNDYHLDRFQKVKLLGIGKAALAMSTKLAGILGTRLDGGLVITKHAALASNAPLEVMEGDHPVPGERSLAAGRKVQEFISDLKVGDLLFCLISGGGSSLMTTPRPGISLEDIQELNRTLLASGAKIDEINTIRRRLEILKGGGLARAANGATIVSLLLSDVVGNSLDAIASGPTAPDCTTGKEIQSLIDKYKLKRKLPAPIFTVLQDEIESPAAGDRVIDKARNIIVGSGLQAAQAALSQAELEGFHPYLLRLDVQGEAKSAAFELATTLRQASLTGEPVPGPACIVAGGETTVTLHGNGKGGRNTEMALWAVTELADFPRVMLITLATDGEDGPTDAAGAVVTGETLHRAAALGINPTDYLNRNDSYSFFAALDDLLKPGPTGTNVNDLVFMFLL